MNFKRIISLMLTIILMLSTIGVIPAAAEDSSKRAADLKYVTNVMLTDDFESYNEGEAIPETGNIYLLGRNTQWGQNDAVVVKEDITGNKVAKLYSETGATLNMYKVPFNATERTEQNMLIKARVKPMAGTSQIIIRQYVAPTQYVYPVVIQDGTLKCFGTTVGTVQMDKWTDIEILIDIENNRSCVYINGVLTHEKDNLFNDDVYVSYPVVYFRSAVSAGGSAYWDDIYIREMGTIDKETWKEKGNNLEALEGVHPRIFATADDFENMKRMAVCELSEEYEALLKGADSIIKQHPPEYHMGTNKEQLWQRDVASNILRLLFAYKISGEQKYKDEVSIWANAAINYPTWGMESCENCDLAAGAMLVATSCYYDWLYHEISDEEKAAFVKVLSERGTVMKGGSWYDSNYLQNHLWIARSGLYVAAAALYDVYEPAITWFNTANQSYASIFKYLGRETGDGASHEGFGYYSYGLGYMLYYLDIADKFLNIDYSDHAFLTNAYKYISNMIIPGTYNNNGDYLVWSYGDQTKYVGVSQVEQLAMLASYTGSEETQWWVNHWRDEINDHSGNLGLNELFLWYDEGLGEKSLEEQGRTNDELLDHLKLFFSRTGWDDNSTLVAYRCGPLFGEDSAKNPPKYDLGYGHNHGDLNSMNIYTRGENLFADMEYGNVETSAHSTLMVNGLGQERNAASITRLADIIKIDSQDAYSYSVGDATGMYNEDTTGLTKFHRHFIYLKPDILILVDDVETKESERAIPLELRFFPASSNFETETDGSVTFELENTTMNIYPADMQEGVVSACGTITKGNASGLGLTVTTNNQKLIQPTVISWNDKDKTPVKVDVIRKNNSKLFEFYTNRDKITLDIENMTVTHEIIKTGDTALKLDGALIDGDYLATLNDDYRFYMEADEIAEVLGFTAETAENTVTFSKGTKKTVMTVGSNAVSINGKEITMDAVPYVVGDNIMVPVRYAAQGFGVGVDYNESDKVLAFRSNANFSGADLRSITANGVGIQVEDGIYDYSINTFGFDAQVSALAKDSSTKIEIINGGMGGTTVIKTTSADETNTKTYTINVNPKYGIGNVGIYGMSYSESDGNVGENAFDVNYGTRWAASGIGQWIFMDLGSKVKLDSMLVAYAYGNTRQEYFDIQVSDDGINWTTIAECNSSGKTKEAEKHPMNGVETRYVRFWSKGQGQGGWTSVSEIGLIKAE